ncbi:kinase-like domain-containing protein [Suillus occidentalis]|nr:kinase-like domain-containing protein [Suillus occidentalis]
MPPAHHLQRVSRNSGTSNASPLKSILEQVEACGKGYGLSSMTKPDYARRYGLRLKFGMVDSETSVVPNKYWLEVVSLRAGNLSDDLTPFITRTTQDHISGGGFGDVWKCIYNADGNSSAVAIKAFRYPDQYDDSERINKKIAREIGILTILRHDNIVPLLGTATGFGQRPELPSLVTPWIPNGTLNVYLTSHHNDLTMLDRSRMLEGVSAGLRYLHSVPVVHGDITGANILIDEGGQAKLIDFGLSSVVLPLFGQSHLAATSIHAGAIRYAAPELLSDDVGDLSLEKTDIYSFGCVMLQILSGRHPWSEIRSQKPEFHIYGLIGTSFKNVCNPDLNFGHSADEVYELVKRRPGPSDSSSPPDYPPDDHGTHSRERNIVIFGETGSGKSSIINAIAQKQLAKTSNDAHGCTSTIQRYPVEISGQRFVLIDTVGLNLGTVDALPTAKAEKKLKGLLRDLMSSRLDGISLLVYCMYSTIAPCALVRAYNEFYSGICQKKAPIVVVVTGLEKETRMENWWDTNKDKFENTPFAGHACVTALWEHPNFPDNITRHIAESSDILRELVFRNSCNCSDLVIDDGSDLAVDKSWLKQMSGKIVSRKRMANKK